MQEFPEYKKYLDGSASREEEEAKKAKEEVGEVDNEKNRYFDAFHIDILKVRVLFFGSFRIFGTFF